ncbi:hypothetical protein CKA32_006736 [Geitlerinema sp. FC II]|nr:hypothetical protein CKA32_006736 [Geitlerinema sp. FC II]
MLRAFTRLSLPKPNPVTLVLKVRLPWILGSVFKRVEYRA